jgi:hypothetical protein
MVRCRRRKGQDGPPLTHWAARKEPLRGKERGAAAACRVATRFAAARGRSLQGPHRRQRYRDLLASADSIIAMREIAGEASKVLAARGCHCRRPQHTHRPLPRRAQAWGATLDATGALRSFGDGTKLGAAQQGDANDAALTLRCTAAAHLVAKAAEKVRCDGRAHRRRRRRRELTPRACRRCGKRLGSGTSSAPRSSSSARWCCARRALPAAEAVR